MSGNYEEKLLQEIMRKYEIYWDTGVSKINILQLFSYKDTF